MAGPAWSEGETIAMKKMDKSALFVIVSRGVKMSLAGNLYLNLGKSYKKN